MQTEILDFPYDEADERTQFIKKILPLMGAELMQYQNSISIRHSRDARSDRILMNEADTFILRKLTDALHAQFPDDSVISENSFKEMKSGNFSWWIDPVDGTRNFIHGVPLYVISVGLAFRNDPVGGVVYVPSLREMYHALLGHGAYKNENPIQVSSIDTAERLLVSSGLPFHRKEILAEILSDMSAFIRSGSGLRRTGSTVLDLCWIAEGRFDALWERDTGSWDTCAASVILTEAGGKISGLHGEPFDIKTKDILASNTLMHDALITIMKSAKNMQGLN
jgi:myo-inositol-1(or 4)-monophosphatase